MLRAFLTGINERERLEKGLYAISLILAGIHWVLGRHGVKKVPSGPAKAITELLLLGRKVRDLFIIFSACIRRELWIRGFQCRFSYGRKIFGDVRVW
jgi:hypothetical protein